MGQGALVLQSSLCRDLDQTAEQVVEADRCLPALPAELPGIGERARDTKDPPCLTSQPQRLAEVGVLLPPRLLGLSGSRSVSSEPKLHLGPLLGTTWTLQYLAVQLGGALAARRGCVRRFEGEGILQPSFPPGLSQPSLVFLKLLWAFSDMQHLPMWARRGQRSPARESLMEGCAQEGWGAAPRSTHFEGWNGFAGFPTSGKGHRTPVRG